MRVLVTGINGFVGPHLAERLLKEGYEVWGIGTDAKLQHPKLKERTHYLCCDLLNSTDLCKTLSGLTFEYVVHLAGISSVARSFSDPEKTYSTNVIGTVNLLNALKQTFSQIKKFLYISTGDLYQESETPVSETAPLEFLSPYAASKYCAEIVCRQYMSCYQLPVVIARPFNHIGPGQSEDFFIPAMVSQIKKIQDSGEIYVGNLAPVKDFSDVRDVCDAYVILLISGKKGEVYNIASGRGFSLQDVLNKIISLSGKNIAVKVDAARYRPVEKTYSVGDASKIRELGWQPKFSLEQTLLNLLNNS